MIVFPKTALFLSIQTNFPTNMQIENTPLYFKTGVRCIMLLLRSKDGGSNRPDYSALRYISTNEIEFDAIVARLHTMQKTSVLYSKHRIYSSVNPRDMSKAIYNFKVEQLANDLHAPDVRDQFYIDIKNRFFGALSTPRCAARKDFLFDIDSNEGDDFQKTVEALQHCTEILLSYPTPNGWHIITKPFNYTKIYSSVQKKLKKDALLYISN